MSALRPESPPWPKVRMDEICQLHYGKALTASKRRRGAVPVYGSNGVTGWHDTALRNGKTVILGRKGQGPLGVEWRDGPFWVIDTAYYTTFDDRIDPRFFYYFVDLMGLNHLKDGTSNPSLTRDIFGMQEIPLPPLEEQREIAAILQAFDDKIELNRQISATLEEMARAFYRSWFVDFDPVHARALGQPPAYMDPATADLFPDSFGQHGLPKGWKEKSLDDIADFLNGAALQKYPAVEGKDSLPVIKIAELRGGVTTKSDRAGLYVPEKYMIADGDVLFSWSGSLMQKVWTEGPGALNQHLFKVTSQVVPQWLHFFAVDQHLAEFQQIAASKATTMGHIQRHHLKEAMVALPADESVIAAADETIRPLFERAVTANLESQKLAALRDTLLPRLMSNQLRVREGEKRVEELA